MNIVKLGFQTLLYISLGFAEGSAQELKLQSLPAPFSTGTELKLQPLPPGAFALQAEPLAVSAGGSWSRTGNLPSQYQTNYWYAGPQLTPYGVTTANTIYPYVAWSWSLPRSVPVKLSIFASKTVPHAGTSAVRRVEPPPPSTDGPQTSRSNSSSKSTDRA